MSQPDELHACPYCGEEHPARVVCRTTEPAPLSRAALRRAERLFSPDRMKLVGRVESLRSSS